MCWGKCFSLLLVCVVAIFLYFMNICFCLFSKVISFKWHDFLNASLFTFCSFSVWIFPSEKFKNLGHTPRNACCFSSIVSGMRKFWQTLGIVKLEGASEVIPQWVSTEKYVELLHNSEIWVLPQTMGNLDSNYWVRTPHLHFMFKEMKIPKFVNCST